MYADVPSVTKPILHSKDLPHPVCPGSSSANILDDNNSDVEFKSISSDSDEFSPQENTPHLINQAEFNDLVRDLQLSRSKAELLAPAYNNGTYYYQTQKLRFQKQKQSLLRIFKREDFNQPKNQAQADFEWGVSTDVEECASGTENLLMELGINELGKPEKFFTSLK
ncbi:hypothetical protein EVAR_80239_1 [Eumeta japonica]|uniref:Uncharacterized protein n=1 Tax=Eumeta variegata TaxID=151549 RepID=A0A4C1UCD9_EUMVA|nr:hypothetical protein EVAR_80239_1 [Eumeta japonica]